jgi:2-haloacid dehalogenase
LSYLKKNYVVATLSNGNISMLIDIARHAGLSWDAVLSSELFRHYKPDRQNYLGAADLLGCRPDELMMVAAHPSDLRVARDCGLKTAFVPDRSNMAAKIRLPHLPRQGHSLLLLPRKPR